MEETNKSTKSNSNPEENVEKNNIQANDKTTTSKSESINYDNVTTSESNSSPLTPLTTTTSTSASHTLKHSGASTFRILDRRVSRISLSSKSSLDRKNSTISSCSQLSPLQDSDDQLAILIGWYPAFLLRFYFNLILHIAYFCIVRLPIMIPTLWVSSWLWLFWKCIQMLLSVVKEFLIILYVPPVERYRKKRTVLISGGSTVQSIHLARNFYRAGARVVVCEIEGHFGLARFSTAVHKYYMVPKPDDDLIQLYISSLKDIIINENVTYYIPVSKTNSAYYDALAKPQIEALGCECICPDVKEVLFFDDVLEFTRKVSSQGSMISPQSLIQNKADLDRLYNMGMFKTGKHFMVNVGLSGVKRKCKISLPSSRTMLKLIPPITEQNPWLVIQDYNSDHYVTCTTIKESCIVANVTCRLDKSGFGLAPIEHEEIELWLTKFFAALPFRRVTGHMSFSFAVASESGGIVPVDCQVGVRLPYMCYTSVHPRIVWRPCRHFSRSTSGPIVTDSGRYWFHKIFLKTIRHPSVEAVSKLGGAIFDRQEALFVFWDPLPYCAFYYLQLPLKSISDKIA